jgi:hypothetical protein
VKINAVVDAYFEHRAAIFKHVGYVENWRILPIVDYRRDYWSVDKFEREYVRHSPNREAIAYWIEHDDYGKYGDRVYENSIYTQRHLPKWVYRGKELTIVVVDTHTDGNQYLQLFANDREIKS